MLLYNVSNCIVLVDQSERNAKQMAKHERGESRKHRDNSAHSGGDQRSSQKAQLPTADGSRQSKLDKDNAEKEVKNTNIWTQRKKQMEKKVDDEPSYQGQGSGRGQKNKFEAPEQTAVSLAQAHLTQGHLQTGCI